jgi:hypothetical protein
VRNKTLARHTVKHPHHKTMALEEQLVRYDRVSP